MDFTSGAKILNSKEDTVEIKIVYDKIIIDSLRKSSNSSSVSNYSFIENEAMYAGKSYSIDTILFSISYTLYRNQELPFTHNPGFKPDLSMIKLIEIKSKNKTVILNKSNFNSEFIEKEKGLWVYTIK